MLRHFCAFPGSTDLQIFQPPKIPTFNVPNVTSQLDSNFRFCIVPVHSNHFPIYSNAQEDPGSASYIKLYQVTDIYIYIYQVINGYKWL